MNKKLIVWVGLGGVAVLVLAYFFSTQIPDNNTPTLPYFTFSPDSNKLLEQDGKGDRLGSFSLTDQRGDVFTNDQIKGKVVVADYFFVSCPGICKEMGSQMQRIYKTFESEKGVMLISHTSKPEEDSASVLMDYAERMGVTKHDKWVFLTGNKKPLYELARNQYHIVDEPGDGGSEDFIHTERFVLVDPKGYIRGYYDGTDAVAVDKLIADIRTLLK